MPSRDELLAIAIDAEATYQRLLKIHPPGTFDKARNDAHWLQEQALICATWLEAHGMTELANIGSFMTTKLAKGQRVRIRKGSFVSTTHPQYRGGLTTARDRYVTVFDVHAGYVDPSPRSNTDQVQNPTIHWVGASSYWFWSDLNNVDILDAAETVPTGSDQRREMAFA